MVIFDRLVSGESSGRINDISDNSGCPVPPTLALGGGGETLKHLKAKGFYRRGALPNPGRERKNAFKKEDNRKRKKDKGAKKKRGPGAPDRTIEVAIVII